jgi:hypothetical protein
MVSPPEAIGQALEALEARKAELTQAQRAHREAQQAIAEARVEDTRLIAQALDAGQKAPARKLEAAAERRALDAQAALEVAAERLRTADERAAEALEAEHVRWREDVEAAWGATDERALEAVAELRAALEARNTLVVLRGHIGRLADPRTRPQALAHPPLSAGAGVSSYIGANGSPVGAEELLASFEAHVQATGLATVVADERAQRDEHEHAQRVQRERDQETRQREEAEAAGAERRVGPPHISR